MTALPLDVIDPEAATLRARRQFEHHLDLLAPIMDALITSTVPHLPASQLNPKITGANGIDNMTPFLRAFNQSTHGTGTDPGGAAADATSLWWDVIDYVRAVTAWINTTIPTPWAPDLPPTWTTRPDADPLTARALALTTAGWLIDRWHLIEPIHELDDTRDHLFAQIRRMQGRYGVHPNPRRPRARCAVCGALAVVVTWTDNPNGSARPVKAGRCRQCGQEYADAPDHPPATITPPRAVLSSQCADLIHEACQSIHCDCACHNPNERTTS